MNRALPGTKGKFSHVSFRDLKKSRILVTTQVVCRYISENLTILQQIFYYFNPVSLLMV